MNRRVRGQRRGVAALCSAAMALSASSFSVAAEAGTATTPPGYTGYDLTIVSLRSHGSNCPTTGPCIVGRYQRGANQVIRQDLGDDGRSSTLARVTAWNWEPTARRIQLRAMGSSHYYKVVYYAGSENITRAIVAGTYRTPLLKRGEYFAIRMRVSMRIWVPNGHTEPFAVRALDVKLSDRTILGDKIRTEVTSVPWDTITPPPPPPTP